MMNNLLKLRRFFLCFCDIVVGQCCGVEKKMYICIAIWFSTQQMAVGAS